MKLIALRCPHCNNALQPNNEDIVLACSNCHNPVAIAVDGPKRIKTRFALPSGFRGTVTSWAPFWVFEGSVIVTNRETQSGWRTKDKDSERLWGSPRIFYVPAWDLNVHTAQDVGSQLIEAQPQFSSIDQPAELEMIPAVIKPSDAEKLLEFIVLAIEARRKDWLKKFEFTIEIGKPQLWVLPSSQFRE